MGWVQYRTSATGWLNLEQEDRKKKRSQLSRTPQNILHACLYIGEKNSEIKILLNCHRIRSKKKQFFLYYIPKQKF